MKGIMIVFNQALSEEIIDVLDELEIRGFTKLNDLQGRGTDKGEPRMGTHTWPALNNAIFSVAPAEKVQQLVAVLKDKNAASEEQGLKAFTWDVETPF